MRSSATHSWRQWLPCSKNSSVVNSSAEKGPVSPFPIHHWLTGSFVCGPRTGSCDSMIAMAVPWSEDGNSQLFLNLLAFIFCHLFVMFSELCVCVCYKCLARVKLQTFQLFSAPQLMDFCIHHHPLQREASLVKAEYSNCLWLQA